MSYDIDLLDPVTKEVIELDQPHQMKGSTYVVSGSNQASLNITYNYGKLYKQCINQERGIRHIYGMTGAESIFVLQQAANTLGNDVDDDYWKATEGNAKKALLQLIALAQLRPDGIWSGD